MKLLIISDIEDTRWKFGSGQADILLSCGDVPSQVILEAAKSYSCSRVFSVKGNHDDNTPFPEPIVDLHLKTHVYMGIKFGGLNGAWKYKPRGQFLYEQSEVETFLASFPPVDVFISHNSPRGIHDKADAVHRGFYGLRTYILRARPRLVLHGHQGISKETELQGTRIVGVYGFREVEL